MKKAIEHQENKNWKEKVRSYFNSTDYKNYLELIGESKPTISEIKCEIKEFKYKQAPSDDFTNAMSKLYN